MQYVEDLRYAHMVARKMNFIPQMFFFYKDHLPTNSCNSKIIFHLLYIHATMNKNYTVFIYYCVPGKVIVTLHSFNSSNNTSIITPSPFYRSENWSVKRLNIVPKSSQLLYGRSNIRSHVHQTPKIKFLTILLLWNLKI